MFDGAVFLDVGTHEGQTLEEVVKPTYGFRTIYAFEPMPYQFETARRAFPDPRVQIFDYGLGDHTAAVDFHGANEVFEASIWTDMWGVDPSVVTVCPVVEVSLFFRRHIGRNDTVIVKLNCEGSEIAIMNNLIDSGEIWKITNVMIDFDIRKVTGMQHLEQELIERFREIGFTNYSLCDHVMVGPTHQARIGNWLSTIAQ